MDSDWSIKLRKVIDRFKAKLALFIHAWEAWGGRSEVRTYDLLDCLTFPSLDFLDEWMFRGSRRLWVFRSDDVRALKHHGRSRTPAE